MKVYKDAHMKIFSPDIISKNILEKEFTRGISYFPGSIKNILNILWHAKNNSVKNQEHKQGRQHSFVEIDHEIFSTVILSLPLIQEGQLSVSGERMCTILVNRLED